MTPSQHNRPLGRLLLACALGLTLTACSLSASPADVSAQASVTAPATPIAPDSVPGIRPTLDSDNDADRQRSVAGIDLPDSLALASGIRETIDGYTDDFDDSTARHPDDPSELNVSWEITAAAGPVLGIRVTDYQSVGSQSRTSTTTWYGDIVADTAWTSRDLIKDDDRVADLIQAAVAQSSSASASRTADLQQSVLLADMSFAPDGSITFDLPPQASATGTDLAVRLTPAVSASVLTDRGFAVRREVMASAPFVGIPVPPTTPGAPDPVSLVAPETTNPELMPGINCAVQQCVAITFDDGPGPYTMTLLDELDAAGVKATFFVVGQNVAAHPEIAAAEVARGHEVGGHSWSHRDLSKLSPQDVTADTQQTSAAILSATGIAPPFMRPPYGAKNQPTLDAIGQPAILWNVDTLDWQNKDVAKTTENALATVTPGSIILFHDIHESTVQAIPGIIQELKNRGYIFVTVSQLFAPQQLQAGNTYSHR